MKQIHQKELEDKDEELEDTQKSCQKRVGPHWVGLMLGAPQSSPCPQEPFQGSVLPGKFQGAALPPSPSVTAWGCRSGFGIRDELLPHWRGCWGLCESHM